MSEIITAYPTSGIINRNYYNISEAILNFIKSIPMVEDFFDSIELLGGPATIYSETGIIFSKGVSYMRLTGNNPDYGLHLQNSSKETHVNVSPDTSNTKTSDIPITYTMGTNGTTAIWFDAYSKNVCMVFGKYDEKFFIANTSNESATKALTYTDTGGSVNTLTHPFNGNNISKGRDYIAQPYYHLGINTGDIYTFDGGSSSIPWGKFKLADAEFVRLTSNFALRIK